MTTPDPDTIRAVCARLDPGNDGHWTSQNVPRMDVLEGMGLAITRQALNEVLPGFTRATLRQAQDAAPETAPVAAQEPEEMTVAQASHRHVLARAKRRQEALEYLRKGGYTPADLAPVRSRLDQRIAARNRQERRELAS